MPCCGKSGISLTQSSNLIDSEVDDIGSSLLYLHMKIDNNMKGSLLEPPT
jgi:hypothetical protein